MFESLCAIPHRLFICAALHAHCLLFLLVHPRNGYEVLWSLCFLSVSDCLLAISTSIRRWHPRDDGPHAQSTIALYTQLHAECRQSSLAVYRLRLNWFDLLYNLLCNLLVVQQIDKKSKQLTLSHTVRAMHVCFRPVAVRDAVENNKIIKN